MASSPPAPRSPWFPAFILGWIAFAASVLFLGYVIVERDDSDTPAAPADSDADPGAAASVTIVAPGKTVRYIGTLPPALDDGSTFELAAKESDADLSFDTIAEGGMVTHYYVPVAAIGTGVDSLDLATMTAILKGTITDWGDAAGIPGKITTAVVDLDGGLAAYQRAADTPPAQVFTTYDQLRAAMVVGSGIVALVPFEQLGMPFMPLAVDGVDLARGKGDPAAWPFVERLTVNARTSKGRSVLAAVQAKLRVQLPTSTTIVATGDILQSRCSLTAIQATGDWGAALRGPVGEYLAGADLALGSLDGSIQDAEPPYGCVDTTNLTSPPQVMEALTLAGFDEMTVATNHVFDCGQIFCGTQAFTQTLDRLHAANIKTVGGGLNLEGALAPAIFEVNGVKFGVLGFDDVAAQDLEATDTAPGTAPLDDDYSEERAANEPAFYRPASELEITRFVNRVHQLKQQVDVVIVQVQSGTEDTHDPTDRSEKALRAAADAGADVVVGNQAHWVQALETRGSSFIAYALGNFIFDQVHTPEHTQGYLLETTFAGKKLVAVRLVPYQIANQYKPTFAAGSLRLKILGDVFTASEKLLP